MCSLQYYQPLGFGTAYSCLHGNMMTLTVASFVFCTFVTLSSSITIGLPEDHVDVGSCFDRACISELDWLEIGDKWHHFRLTVKAINDTKSEKIRESIWRVFQNNVARNGDELQMNKNMKDIRNLRSLMDKRTEEIRAVQLTDATTRYDHQAIIAMEGDTTVTKAAYFLYNKHSTVSTLYEYSPQTDTLKVIAGKEHFLGEYSRVQIVGHGRDTTGVMRLSEKSPQDLAKIVRKLPIEMSELGRVSLVGCNVGSDGQSEYLNDGFTEQFLKSLKSEQNIRTEVSSRNGLVSITASGNKETGEIGADGIKWFSKDPLSKTVMRLGEFDEIIRAEIPVLDRVASYNQESSGALVKLTDIDQGKGISEIVKPFFIEKVSEETGNRKLMKQLNHYDVGEFIKTITKTNFLNDIDFVKQKIIDRNAQMIKKNLENTLQMKNVPENKMIIEDVRKIEIKQSRSNRISHHEFIGKAYLQEIVKNKMISEYFQFNIRIDPAGIPRMDLASQSKSIGPYVLDSGIPPNWKYVARLNNRYDRVINVENVRTIESRADLIYEINMLGAFGVDYRNAETLSRYYRFGDTVYQMARSNFYIKWEGMIASDDPVIKRHISDTQVNEKEILNVKNWIWRDSQNRYDFPKDRAFERYPDMKKAIQDEYIDRVIDKEIFEWNQKGYTVSEKSRRTTFNMEDVTFTLVDRGWSKTYHQQYDSGNVLKLMDFFRNGDHVNINRNQIHVLEGSTVLAIGLSEPVRNFRTFSINEMLMHRNTIEPISVARLIEAHPMTRGKSWGYVGHTGPTVNELGYRPEQSRLVLPRELNIARTFLLSRKGEDGEWHYRFLTETEYNQINMPPGELARITSSITASDIHNTIAEFKPEINDAIVRTKPLGSLDIPTITDLEVRSDISSGKAMPIRASVSMVNDYIYVTNYVSRTIAQRSQVTGRQYEIIQSSIEVTEGNIRLTVRDKSNNLETEELNIKIDDESLKTRNIKEEASRKIQDIQETIYTPSKSLTNINQFLGVYGIVMGFRGAVQDFEEGKVLEGIVNVAQSVHGIYGMSQTAQKSFQAISSKLFSTGLQEVETGLSVASTEISTALTEGTTAAEETLTVAGNAAEDIPVLGTVFGVYNTIQDLRRGTAIGYVDAALDAAITISALFGPEALVVTVALTIVRLVIDDFYYAISNELNNLPPDATVLQKVGAVFKGIGEGIVMVLKNIVDFFSLGFLSFAETSDKIDRQYEKDHDLLHKMSDFHNYFKIEKEDGSHEKLIDFAAGEESWNGGNIVFQLYEDNTARLQMQTVDDNGREQTLDKYITLEEGADDIVLGIGESHDISFKKQSAKIFWFIPVHSRNLISKVRGERNTLHGTYYGNSKNNKFFTIQTLPKNADLGYSLGDYFYEIYGEDGDDIFYLGPQKSKVNGGNGRDTYIIPYSGGKTEINNYATDLEEDILFIQVDFDKINVDRIGNDLILKHGHEHDITVKNWFSGHRMGHMTFKANNGVIFNVTIGVHGKASAVPLAIILSGNTEEHSIDVSRGIWTSVLLITGSDSADTIVANDNNNLLNGGKGYNTIYGGGGSDTYLINSVATSETSDWNVINNFDLKMTVDKVIFDIQYEQINVKKTGTDVQLYTNFMNGPKVTLKNWFSSEHYRHTVFVTADDVIFKLADDQNDPFLLHPIIIDASKEHNGVTLDATRRDFVNVSTIIGSDFDDVITGSRGNNYIKGGKGSDTVMGGEGRDVYVIRQEDIGDFINNFAEDEKDDLLLVDFKYNDISVSAEGSDAILTASGRMIVKIQNWMTGNSWRHIIIRTIDGISFKLEIVKKPNINIQTSPVEIDKSSKTQRQVITTYKSSMRNVEHIIGSNASDYLTGNERANRIDPGFGGAYMMGLGGHDQYIIMNHYNGPNIINNFARDNFTDTVKLPAFFNDVETNVNEEDVVIASSTNPSASVTLEKYKTDPFRRHLVINTVQDGIVFTIPPSRDFKPTAISIDRTNQAHNLIVDLDRNETWADVITVLGSKEHSNVIRGNRNNNTITGGILSDTIEGGEGNDVIRGNQGDDFIDGEGGDDILAGGAGKDWIDGGMGDDIIYPGPDADRVRGGPGFDVIIVFGDANDMTGVFIDLLNGHGYGGDAHGDIYVSVEGIIGGFYNDLLIGDHYENYLDGKEGNDILYPLHGKDILVGGEGKDMYDIGDSAGEKMIRNYADDSLMDYVNLKLYKMDGIYLERRSDDIVLHVGVFLKGVFCPKEGTGPYHMEQWFKDTTYQHLTVQFADGELVLDEFNTGYIDIGFERPDTKDRKEKCNQLLTEMFTDYDNDDYEDYLENYQEMNYEIITDYDNKDHEDYYLQSYQEMYNERYTDFSEMY